MQKRVIINGRFLTHRITGVERYAREICLELDKIIKKGEIEMAIPPETQNIPEYKNIKVVRVGHLHNRAWEHISFSLYTRKSNGISLNLCNVAPILNPGIVVIHDVKIKARPKDFSKKFLFWYKFLFFNETKRAQHIITVSQFSKNEIIKYYHIKAQKITVIPNSWQHFERIKYDEDALEKYGLIKGKYYFSMCSLEPNKNFMWIAEAAKNNPNDIFAVAGSVNKTIFVNRFGFVCPKNMKLLGYVSDEEAKTLMRECAAFIFPTFYEGFGIPPMEAICAGAQQVIVSNTEIMHEIYGNEVMYIDPYNTNVNIKQITSCPRINKEKILSKYSWEKSAYILYRIIKKFVNC